MTWQSSVTFCIWSVLWCYFSLPPFCKNRLAGRLGPEPGMGGAAPLRREETRERGLRHRYLQPDETLNVLAYYKFPLISRNGSVSTQGEDKHGHSDAEDNEEKASVKVRNKINNRLMKLVITSPFVCLPPPAISTVLRCCHQGAPSTQRRPQGRREEQKEVSETW